MCITFPRVTYQGKNRANGYRIPRSIIILKIEFFEIWFYGQN